MEIKNFGVSKLGFVEASKVNGGGWFVPVAAWLAGNLLWELISDYDGCAKEFNEGFKSYSHK